MAPTSSLVQATAPPPRTPRPPRRRRPLALLVLLGCAVVCSASLLLAILLPSSSAAALFFFPWRSTRPGLDGLGSAHPLRWPPPTTTTAIDYTDRELVDDPAERALARTCRARQQAPTSVLATLPFYDDLILASRNGSLPNSEPSSSSSSSGLLRSPAAGDETRRLWHPMLGLIQAGEAAYQAKLASQSQTLDAARAAYSRRYSGRLPPQGFDVWWAFAEANDVVFPDEHRATDLLEPFRALGPEERRRRLRRAERALPGEEGKRQALVRIFNGPEGLGWAPLLDGADEAEDGESGTARRVPPRVQRRPAAIHKRTKAHLALLQPIQHLLPHFSAVLNLADQPVVLLDPKEPGQLEDPSEPASRYIDWRAFCARRAAEAAFAGGTDPLSASSSSSLSSLEAQATVAFVQNVSRAADPCVNSKLLDQHGYYLQDSAGPSADLLPLTHRQLVPILSLASTKHHADLLVPAVGVEGRIERVGPLDVPWEDKSERLYWRGSATGMYNHAPPRGSNESPRWLDGHRPRLSHFANSLDGEGVQPVALAVDGTTGRMAVGPSAVGWKARWLDVHLASTGWWRWFAWWPETGQQCSWWDGTCRRLGREFAYVSKDPAGTADGHRFTLDVDGNAWSARFPRLMASRGLPLKATAFDEWNAGLFPTWLGYVPLNNDYSDLESVLAFLQTPELDGVAREMAEAGRCWKVQTARVVDMQAYMLRLYLELADLFGPADDEDRAAGTDGDADMEAAAGADDDEDDVDSYDEWLSIAAGSSEGSSPHLVSQPIRRPRIIS